MHQTIIDSRTKSNIDKRIQRILSDIGCKEPPVNVEHVLSLLELNRSFYDLDNPSFIQDIFHQTNLTLQKVQNIINAIDLRALWLPNENQVIIAKSLPQTRLKYTSAHEIGHRLNSHHKKFFAVGDTALTLDPYYHEILEQEAHYAANELIFMGNQFAIDALDCKASLNSVFQLKKRYDNSLVTTLRRFVLYGKNTPMAAIIGHPPWNLKTTTNKERCRHFTANDSFRSQYMHPCENIANIVIEQADMIVTPHKGGPTGEGIIHLQAITGEPHAFYCETFFNSFDLIIFIVQHKK